MKRLFLIECLFLLMAGADAGNDTVNNSDVFGDQDDSCTISRRRSTTLAIGGSAAYITSLAGFYHFRFHDKLQPHFQFCMGANKCMKGLDATHHLLASYHTARLSYDLLKWSGMNETQSAWGGTFSSLVVFTSEEIMDGFSAEWKASVFDQSANVLGSALFISQQLIWHQQKMVLKWSYHPTQYPNTYPDALGTNFAECAYKDYNGQTFWLSANLRSFTGKPSWMPPWLNVAVGYGINGVSGLTGPLIKESGDTIPEPVKRCLLYVSPDIDLSRIHTRSSTLKWVFEAIGFLKFPLPALEFSNLGLKFHPLFF